MKTDQILPSLTLALLLGSCTAVPVESDQGYGDYVAGQYARSIDDTDSAVEFYYSALKSAPANREILQEAFSLAIMEGRLEMAVDLAARLEIAGHPNAVAAMLLSLDALRGRNFDEALTHLANAKGTGFDSLVSPLVRAWVEASRGEIDAAIEALRPLGEISVFRAYRNIHTAYILDFAGRDVEAEAAYIALLANEDTALLPPVLSYGLLLERLGRADDARAMYQSQLQRAPENIYLLRAVEQIGDRTAKELSATDPRHAISVALLRAATELSRDNARTPAVLYARLATFLAPDLDEANLLLGTMFIAFEQPKTSLEALAKIDQESPLSDQARVREAIAWDDLEEADKAVAVLSRYLEKEPTNVGVLTALGDIYRVQEEFEEALEQYDLALASVVTPDRNDWFLFFSRGISFERLDRWEEAEADFLQALELMPDEPQVLNYLGYSWIDRGLNIEPAKAMIEKAVEQRPNDGFIVDSLGWVHYLLGQYEDAVQNLERAILLEPDDPTINDHLGDAYWMAGRRIEARFQWNHALILDPEHDQIPQIEDKIAFGLNVEGASYFQ